MGLQSTAVSSAAAKPTGSVTKKVTGASSAPEVYTVPDGKYFQGYIFTNNGTTPMCKINGVEISTGIQAHDGKLILFTLVAGDVVKANTNTSFQTYVNGAEYDL